MSRTSLGVGVIGVGAMGAAHARALATVVAGAHVAGLHEYDPERAAAVAQQVGTSVHASAAGLIGSAEVDAVVVASPDRTHAELVLACIAAGKPVLCEKPLAVGLGDSERILAAEQQAGHRLVQVGFMRRYDPGYVALKATIGGGEVGPPRLVHCVHRNVSAHRSVTSESIVTGSMVHELDIVRWLLDDEITSISVRSPQHGPGLADPQLATLEMASGVLVSVDVFVNAGYGYDVRCEVVGAQGTVSLVPPVRVATRAVGIEGGAIAGDFVVRFDEAYRLELADWVRATGVGRVHGATAWDGHVAGLVSAAGVEALHSGQQVAVQVPDRPALYA